MRLLPFAFHVTPCEKLTRFESSGLTLPQISAYSLALTSVYECSKQSRHRPRESSYCNTSFAEGRGCV